MTYNYEPNKKKAEAKITNLRGAENNYRKYGLLGDTEEDQQAAFVWFLVEIMLAKVSPTTTKFVTNRTDILVSNIFSAEDEAWTLL